MLAPESFTISIQFVAICMEFNITWKFGGNLITEDSNHIIVNKTLGNSWYKSSVTVKHSSESDSGTYTARVASTTGSDSITIKVTVISKLLVIIHDNLVTYLVCYNFSAG